VVGGPVLGTVIGAGAGWLGGLLISGAIDAAYDNLLPQSLKDSIERGGRPIENAIKGPIKAMEAGVNNVWDAIF
jgi:hypothetical protein